VYSFYLGNILIPVVAIVLAAKYINLEKLIRCIYLVLLISNILIITIFLDQRNWELAIEILVNRAEIKGTDDSLLVNPISYGLYGGYLFVLSSTLLVIFKKSISSFLKILLWFSILIGFVNLLISTSRGPFLFTSLALFILFISSISIKKINVNVLLRTIFISFLVIFILNLFTNYISDSDIEIGIFQRFVSTKESLQSGEKEIRNELYQEGLDMFANSPFLGKKFVLDSTQSYPHNVFIEILMSLGLFGFFIYGLIIVLLFIKIVHYLQNNIYLAPLCYLFVLSFGISLTTGNLYQSVENWNILALLLVFPFVSEKSTMKTSSVRF
jgi:O-antigen ligase